jgi:arsenate reductase-like glutaredoxin family protein
VTVTIYHNPPCSTSRHALAMLRASGVEPKVIEYVRTLPTCEERRDPVRPPLPRR